MQTREQWMQSKKWKVVAGVTTAATLGVGGIALAGAASADDTQPEPIRLEQVAPPSPQIPPAVVVPGLDGRTPGLDTDLDSPFDDTPDSVVPTGNDTPDDSPDRPSAVDTPDDSPDVTTTTVAQDTPDDSPDRPSAVDTPDDSPDRPSGDDSPDDDGDSPDSGDDSVDD